MSIWSIGLTESPGGRSVISDVLSAQAAWKRLTPSQRLSVSEAYCFRRPVFGHPNTLAALKRHGFTDCGMHTNYEVRLTGAAQAVARWCVRSDAA